MRRLWINFARHLAGFRRANTGNVAITFAIAYCETPDKENRCPNRLCNSALTTSHKNYPAFAALHARRVNHLSLCANTMFPRDRGPFITSAHHSATYRYTGDLTAGVYSCRRIQPLLG